jgi:hypothetical protein
MGPTSQSKSIIKICDTQRTGWQQIEAPADNVFVPDAAKAFVFLHQPK